MSRFVLIGLCEPTGDDVQEQFEELFVDEHIEDTARCPNFIRGSVFKLSGPHVNIDTPSAYLSLYEVEADSYDEAERVLNEWQRDPDAWEGRQKHLETGQKFDGTPMRVKWLRLVRADQVLRRAESWGGAASSGSNAPMTQPRGMNGEQIEAFLAEPRQRWWRPSARSTAATRTTCTSSRSCAATSVFCS